MLVIRANHIDGLSGSQPDRSHPNLRISASDLVNLQTSGADVQHVGVLPWHGALRDARAAYGEHNKAWLSVVTKTISNPAAAFDKAANANIDATFQTAHHRFDEAVPPFALFHLQHRVDAIFAS